MNMPIERTLNGVNKLIPRDISGMPEAFRRAYGPTEAFSSTLGELERNDVAVASYQGNRTINPRSRGSCRIFAVWPDLETTFPRVYGLDSLLEYHHLALTLVDKNVRQVQEQYGPIRYRKEDGSWGSHFFDLLKTNKCGRREAVAIKPTSRLLSGRFFTEIRRICSTMPKGTADEVRLVTEKSFSRVKATNAATYLRFALCPDLEADALIDDAVQKLAGELTISDLIQISQTGPRGFRAAFRAIYEERITLVSTGHINLHSIVRRPQ
ncbi:hypothetical protein [Celeribacter halophilus]|uniref:hypothetical protein n=1 Tax=Celeribacter halophilus TaxID=576117 RepID=UPI001C0A2642|nr:hypothetical protein [Celeribacter halophilus]MBU2891332.1 hypothetical protein [Celeribacter halophilus]MDO6512349.1 hypothetical protein [Celeribacter halophilus]